MESKVRHRLDISLKKYDDNTDLSMEYALKAVLDFIIPEIAITMIEKRYFYFN